MSRTKKKSKTMVYGSHEETWEYWDEIRELRKVLRRILKNPYRKTPRTKARKLLNSSRR
jgi:hypothetical protein